MSTPSIQTLITQAQQVLNLKSSNEIRATLAAVLANANVGTPLNPNLTTQQLWDEFYEIVRQPSDDIMSIITDQMMRMVFSPPAPGGAGADKQVIFNDGGVLAGDTKFLWDKNANQLDVDGPVVITGDLTVDTNVLKVDTSLNRVGVNNAAPSTNLHVGSGVGLNNLGVGLSRGATSNFYEAFDGTKTFLAGTDSAQAGVKVGSLTNHSVFLVCNNTTQLQIDPLGVFSFTDGAGGTRMTLNATGLGVGVAPVTDCKLTVRGGSIFDRGVGGGSPQLLLSLAASSGGNYGQISNTGTRWALGFGGTLTTVGTEALVWDSSGNVGIGVTPSASWVTYKALEFDTGIVSGSSSMALNRNCYFDGVNWRYKVTTSFGIAQYQLSGNGNHIWNIAPSGTAGNAITFTQAMTLDASGNLMVGVASSSNRLDIQKSTDCAVLVKSTGANTNIAMDYVSNYGNHTIRKSGTAVWDFGVINDSSATPAFKFSNGPSAVGVQLVHGATAWTALSDETVKDIIEPITNAITKVGSLRSVIGKFKTDDASKRRSFLIAQDVFAVLPEAVDVVGEKNELGVRYSDVIPLLVAAIKELSAEVNALKNA